MSTFLCARCGAIENTATSDYWIDVMEGNKLICSKCKTGVWHNRFERKHWSEYGIAEVLRAQKLNQGDCINAKEHLRDIGVIGSKKNTVKEIEWKE